MKRTIPERGERFTRTIIKAGDRRKSPSVPGAAIAIFADRRDRRIKSPISDMSDIGD